MSCGPRVEALAVCALTTEELIAATELARTLRRRLSGPPRPRWYEADRKATAPHGVHGGWVAALFDDLLGSVQGLTGAPGMTAMLTVRYREVTPIDEDLELEGWIERNRGRRVVAKATCRAGGTVSAQAEALFVGVDFDGIRERMKQRRDPGG